MRGFTLLELTVVVTLLLLGLSVALPAARRMKERSAVLGAREAVVGMVARARREAVLEGGATLHVRRAPGVLWIQTRAGASDTLDLGREFDARLRFGSPVAEVRFDRLGVGRLANLSLTVERGSERAGVTLSAYGRVRRW